MRISLPHWVSLCNRFINYRIISVLQYPKTLETDRLILSATDYNDTDFLIELTNTESYKKFIGYRKLHTERAARKYIRERVFRQFRSYGFCNFTVSRKEDGRKIGTCGLYHRTEHELFDLGFAFLPEFEGHGYAYEAAEKVKQFGVDTAKIENIRAFCTTDNSRSQKLLQKLGFVYKDMASLPNDPELLMMYELAVD